MLAGRGARALEPAPPDAAHRLSKVRHILDSQGFLRRAFEPACRPSGESSRWAPWLVEALNAGSINIGHTGDSPPLFAQAAGVPFVYLVAASASPESSGSLVRCDSPVHTAADYAGIPSALSASG